MNNFIFKINKKSTNNCKNKSKSYSFSKYSLYANLNSRIEWKHCGKYFVLLYGNITNTMDLKVYGEQYYEIIISLYKTKGINGFDLLRGKFAIILVEIDAQITLLVKDFIGSKALYLFESLDAIYISSHATNFSNYTSISEEYINKIILGENIYGTLTPFINVRNICNGKVTAIFRNNTIKTFSYLKKKKTIEYKNENDYYEHFKELLKKSIISIKDNNVGFALSGGLDSSLLWETYCLNNKRIAKGFTFDLSNYAKSDETELINSYKKQNNITKINVQNGFEEMIYMEYYDEPNYYFLTNAWRNLVDFSKSEKCSCIISGLGGDEITIGQSYISDCILKCLPSKHKSSDTNKNTEKNVRYNNINNYYINLLKFRLYNGEIGRFIYRYEQDCFENKNISLLLPYLNREIVEFCTNIPINIHVNHETTKQLQRKAGEGILPYKILRNKKKNTFNDWFITELYRKKDLVYDLLNGSELEEYYEKAFFNNLAENFYNGKNLICYAEKNKIAYTLMNYISCEIWLRKIKQRL